MTYFKGERIITTKRIHGYDVGAPGTVIRVDGSLYTVRFDDEAVFEDIDEKDLFAPGRPEGEQ